MSIIVRRMRADESRLFLTLHGRSVRGLATTHYTPAVIDAWTVPLTDEFVYGFEENADGEIRLIAELDGEPAGLGALVVKTAELRACYVVPEAARRGVGSALVREIERLAIAHGVEQLHLHASLNAEPFYARLGYRVDGRTEIGLRGQPMAAVLMSKRL
jgi:putative acetyltransferase